MLNRDAAPETRDADLFRDAFVRACSHLPAGVAVLTGVDAEDGTPFGLTVSSVAFVSAAPPLISVCLDRASTRIAQLRRSRRFCINLLAEGQSELAKRFATSTEDRFAGVAWEGERFGAPVLEDVLGVLACEVWGEMEAGDHQLIVGEVKDLLLKGGRPLVYWRRAFHGVKVEYPFAANDASLEDFFGRWREGTLPKAAWTHAAHVGMAAYIAFDHAEEEAFALTKKGILHHNQCVGTPNTDTSGYHETLTRFWCATVGEFVRAGGFESHLEAVRAAVERFGADRDRHSLFYSSDVVRDTRARREWIPPDREPDPCLCGIDKT
jgi:flavin reductase (DIM6/NTAB) family NADH-FMN oxidoreductase RutF